MGTGSDQLAYSCSVGGTHWEALGGGKGLPGPRPVLFFAPAQIKKRVAEWGARLASAPGRRRGRLSSRASPIGDRPWLRVVAATGSRGRRRPIRRCSKAGFPATKAGSWRCERRCAARARRSIAAPRCRYAGSSNTSGAFDDELDARAGQSWSDRSPICRRGRAHFRRAEIPVLRETVEALEALRANEEQTDANSIGEMIGGDPLMTLKVLATRRRIAAAASSPAPRP